MKAAKAAKPKPDREPAARLPIARVSVEVPLAHLDRPFDYLVSVADDEAAQPGVRVKVRFAGQLVNGFLLERVESSPHGGKLAYLDKVVSPERILDPEVARLARAVADRYAGNLSDVLRLAVPPRHARVESQAQPAVASPASVVTAPQDDPGEPGAISSPGSASDVADPGDEPSRVSVPAADREGPTSVKLGLREPGDGVEDAPVNGLPPPVSATNGGVPGELSGAGADFSGLDNSTEGAPDASGGEDLCRATEDSERQERSGQPSPVGVSAPPSGTEADPATGELAEPDAGLGAAAGAGSLEGRSAEPSPNAGSAETAVQHGWGIYPTGDAFLHALGEGRAARAVWSALPGEDWPARIAEAAGATVRGGRGVVIVVADARDLERVDRALSKVLGDGRHVALNAAAGPAERYRRFLAASRHRVSVVAGTRAAMFAPVADLGLVVIWDDGDDLHAEPRAPYPHARDVLLTRAQLAGCAALVAGFARTGEAQLLLETGWAKEIVANRDTLRARSPLIAPTGDDPQLARDPGAVTARLPSLAWQAARGALQAGAPVLVQVPRRGYLPSTACAECRTPARCPHCSGPLGLAGSRDVPACHWCGRAAADYACPACGGRRLRASITGARRTAEELGRAFPGVPVRTSGRDEILDTVPGEASLIVATPGAEPVAEGGYGAVLLLDTWALLSRANLRAAEETMRRWLSAAALAKPGPAGGRVVVVADGSLAPVQALLRWDPGWFAARELAERRELGFPPAARMASLTGTAEAVAEFLDAARLPEEVEVLGPVPAQEEQERMLLRVSRGRAAELARLLHEAAAVRSVKKSALPVRIQIDPAELL
ncbi:primosomal protein N' [Actinoplanes friuliensis DSM 7358]|uniref:Probable replication restart protein PriA n=1 Tax=Actinoplanes friuliensis DSM 7358 TaxID=1246995 RepID=U5W5F2_9ACTN|nr:primosomal protein N' [Actinoplanes friuliensis DSM 7358]